jgi:putative nucleotidyltransferase-like protein
MIPSRPGGQTVMTLSPEDLLVYLCAHGAKHVWEKLIWIVDVAGLINRHSDPDWRSVCDLAARHRCERVSNPAAPFRFEHPAQPERGKPLHLQIAASVG